MKKIQWLSAVLVVSFANQMLADDSETTGFIDAIKKRNEKLACEVCDLEMMRFVTDSLISSLCSHKTTRASKCESYETIRDLYSPMIKAMQEELETKRAFVEFIEKNHGIYEKFCNELGQHAQTQQKEIATFAEALREKHFSNSGNRLIK